MTLFYTVVGCAGAGGMLLTCWIALSIRRERILPRSLLSDVPDLVRLGKTGDALARCARNRSALGAVWRVALESVGRAGRLDTGLLRDVMSGELNRQATLLHARASYLLDVVSGALLAGLLGAVCAVAWALAPSGLDALAAAPGALASALSGSAAAAGSGLLVSLFASMAFAVYRGRGALALDELAAKGESILTAITQQHITNNEERRP